jgi:hypothetical protein
LKADLGKGEWIEEGFQDESCAEKVESRGVFEKDFGEKVEIRCKPASLDRRKRSDEEKIAVDGEEEEKVSRAAREKKREDEGAEEEKRAKVKAGDRQDVLQAKAGKFKAKSSIFYIACEKRGEEGGRVRREFMAEVGAEALCGLVTDFGEAPGIFYWRPLCGFEGVVMGASLDRSSFKDVVRVCGRPFFFVMVDRAGHFSVGEIEGAFIDESLLKGRAVRLE